MINVSNLGHLLSETKRVIAHHHEVEKLKGETFNIFSILKMERKENSTHSAFLAELLNPYGTHQKGSLFLEMFMSTIDVVTNIDMNTANVKVEHSVGVKNEELKIGGRIDIFIHDKNFNCISIENKIDAGDQNTQIERYCNYKKNQNTVIYLNKYGEEPSCSSKGELISGQDFYIISYKQHIIQWLEKCLLESNDLPILRESIKQYIILIKKITNSMDNKEQQEVNALMAKNFAEADYIKDNVDVLKKQIGENIRLDVIELCKKRFSNDFIVIPGNNTDKEYSRIELKFKKHENAKLFFGIESFSYLLTDETMYVGIVNQDGKPTDFKHGDFEGTNYWPNYSIIENFESYRVYFNDYKTLEKLFFDMDFRKRLVFYLVDELEKFIIEHKEPLLNYLNSQVK